MTSDNEALIARAREVIASAAESATPHQAAKILAGESGDEKLTLIVELINAVSARTIATNDLANRARLKAHHFTGGETADLLFEVAEALEATSEGSPASPASHAAAWQAGVDAVAQSFLKPADAGGMRNVGPNPYLAHARD